MHYNPHLTAEETEGQSICPKVTWPISGRTGVYTRVHVVGHKLYSLGSSCKFLVFHTSLLAFHTSLPWHLFQLSGSRILSHLVTRFYWVTPLKSLEVHCNKIVLSGTNSDLPEVLTKGFMVIPSLSFIVIPWFPERTLGLIFAQNSFLNFNIVCYLERWGSS